MNITDRIKSLMQVLFLPLFSALVIAYAKSDSVIVNGEVSILNSSIFAIMVVLCVYGLISIIKDTVKALK